MLTSRQRLLSLTPLALVLLPFLIWPALFGFVASFTNYAPLQTNLHLIGFHNYLSVLRDQLFSRSISNILWMTVVAVPAELAGGLAIAYALRRPFRGRGLLRVALLAPWFISPIANGVSCGSLQRVAAQAGPPRQQDRRLRGQWARRRPTAWKAADAIPWYLSDFGVAPQYKGFKNGFQEYRTRWRSSSAMTAATFAPIPRSLASIGSRAHYRQPTRSSPA